MQKPVKEGYYRKKKCFIVEVGWLVDFTYNYNQLPYKSISLFLSLSLYFSIPLGSDPRSPCPPLPAKVIESFLHLMVFLLFLLPFHSQLISLSLSCLCFFWVYVAAVAWGRGEAMVIEEVEVDPPQPMEIRIKVVCTSLCRSDVTQWESEVLSLSLFSFFFDELRTLFCGLLHTFWVYLTVIVTNLGDYSQFIDHLFFFLE